MWNTDSHGRLGVFQMQGLRSSKSRTSAKVKYLGWDYTENHQPQTYLNPILRQPLFLSTVRFLWGNRKKVINCMTQDGRVGPQASEIFLKMHPPYERGSWKDKGKGTWTFVSHHFLLEHRQDSGMGEEGWCKNSSRQKDAVLPCLGLKIVLLYLHLDNVGLNKLKFTVIKKKTNPNKSHA